MRDKDIQYFYLEKKGLNESKHGTSVGTREVNNQNKRFSWIEYESDQAYLNDQKSSINDNLGADVDQWYI